MAPVSAESCLRLFQTLHLVAEGTSNFSRCKRYCRAFATYFALFLLVALPVVGCEDRGLTRPVGYLRLGKIEDFKGKVTYLPEQRVVLNWFDEGFSAMSTVCPHDLAPLERRFVDGQERWVSPTSGSTYDSQGNVLSGPARVALPFYQLKADAGAYGGVVDTLFVRIGVEVSRDWRLPVDSPST